MPPSVSLPSIHEMFPEHLMNLAAESRRNSDPNPTTKPDYSFDILRSDPSSSSLEHIASSAKPLPRVATQVSWRSGSESISNGSIPAFRVAPSSSSVAVPRPHSASSSAASRQDVPSPSSLASGDLSDDGDEKKHVCTLCSKRFNRPSSLRIHMNTHTGATPFQCPYPGCGRSFNVNSNMRRHYRNHTNAPIPSQSLQQSQSGVQTSLRSSPTFRSLDSVSQAPTLDSKNTAAVRADQLGRRNPPRRPIHSRSPHSDFLILRHDILPRIPSPSSTSTSPTASFPPSPSVSSAYTLTPPPPFSRSRASSSSTSVTVVSSPTSTSASISPTYAQRLPHTLPAPTSKTIFISMSKIGTVPEAYPSGSGSGSRSRFTYSQRPNSLSTSETEADSEEDDEDLTVVDERSIGDRDIELEMLEMDTDPRSQRSYSRSRGRVGGDCLRKERRAERASPYPSGCKYILQPVGKDFTSSSLRSTCSASV
ncbi:hypothetical protein VKT23_015554 [Stygiomarasmius scandens]|uniref:C2H2-type domain-containing protein n=1 Tax=Marasmiellus scandens TaxID=2682957 RepID=A0ABR1J0P7_9AGAR